MRAVGDALGSFRQSASEPGDLQQVSASRERRMTREAEAIPDEELFVTAALPSPPGEGRKVGESMVTCRVDGMYAAVHIRSDCGRGSTNTTSVNPTRTRWR